MSDYPEALDHMMAAWNEPDASKLRPHLAKAPDEDVRYVDPSTDRTRPDAFEANVLRAQKSLPGATFERESDADAQHGFYRYHWVIHQDGKWLTPVFDVTETNDAGKVSCVVGFVGRISEYAES
jgi:hypothetical protein